MPQKKNPDIAELVRGKTGRVYGALTSLLTTMKGIPLAYNKDMQEDKEFVFDAIDTTKGCLALFTGMLKTMKFNTTDDICNSAIELATVKQYIEPGDVVVLTAGIPSQNISQEHTTTSNMMRIAIVD